VILTFPETIEDRRELEVRIERQLTQLRRRNDCFDLLIEFFDRAIDEGKARHANDALTLASLIHKGKRI
jgi:hypothetical protein